MSHQHGEGRGGEREREGQRPRGAGGAKRTAAATISGAQEEGLGREGSRDPQAGMHDHSQRRQNRLTTWNQRGGGGRVQAAKFLSLRRRFHLRPSPRKAECVATNRKGLTSSGHTCFVLSRAKSPSVTSASEMPVTRPNLKCNHGNTNDSLCNRIQLKCVNVLFRGDMGGLTSARTVPYLIVLSMNFSIDPLISGGYSSSNPSS